MSKHKINHTMEGYRSLQNEHQEKNRIRELEHQLAAERARGEMERKNVHEKNILIDELKEKVVEMGNREQIIVGNYEEKLRSFHS